MAGNTFEWLTPEGKALEGEKSADFGKADLSNPNTREVLKLSESQATSGDGSQTALPATATPITTGPGQTSVAPDNGATQAPTQAPTQAGVGANDDNPAPTGKNAQIVVSTSTQALNQLIPTQPNQLDQYASYTYALSWYLLTPTQFNQLTTTQQPNLAGWSLLMQSGGAPITGRNAAFKIDYYMDNLEINSFLVGGGSRRPNMATDIKFNVYEPNGLTLIQNLYTAVNSLYKNTSTRYLSAMYCMVIKFYGYDKDGKLVAPAKGSYQANTSTTGGYGQTAVILKYYPFSIQSLTYRLSTGGQASHGIEYTIKAKPITQFYAASTDRSTIPFAYNLTGETVAELLNGSPVSTKAPGSSATNTADKGTRKPAPMPNQYNIPGWNNLSNDVQMRAQQSWFDTYGRQYNADGTPIGGK